MFVLVIFFMFKKPKQPAESDSLPAGEPESGALSDEIRDDGPEDAPEEIPTKPEEQSSVPESTASEEPDTPESN